MRLALVYVCSGEPKPEEIERLSVFREDHPEIRILIVELDGTAFSWDAHCDRRVALGLGIAHRETATAIGLQLCFNEGHTAVGVVACLDAHDLFTAVTYFDVLERGEADAIIVRGHCGIPDTLFASERAAFAGSFWGAMATKLADVREEILVQVFIVSGRRLVVADQESARIGPRVASPKAASILAANASEIHRTIGMSIGQYKPPRSRPVQKIAVITPYYKEPVAELERCLDSVRDQSHRCDHFMISDGFPSPAARRPGVVHIELGMSHADNGNTPRYVGGLLALAHGYDGIAYLDADNWFERHHIRRLVELQSETFANAACSLRNIYLPDGFKLPDTDSDDIKRRHVDTSCYLLTRDCEFVVHLWGQMPRSWGPVCDRVAYSALQDCRLAWTGNRTVNFKSNYSVHFRMAGHLLPEKVHDVPMQVWKAFARSDANFRAESISRTGRVFSILSPFKRSANRKVSIR